MTAAVRVTVDGEPVTREVTLEQVREYLRAKGWEKRAETDKDDFGKPLGAVVEIWGTGAEEILFWTSGPGGSMMQRRISNVIARVAVHEGRRPAAVLREIASVGALDPSGVEPLSEEEVDVIEAGMRLANGLPFWVPRLLATIRACKKATLAIWNSVDADKSPLGSKWIMPTGPDITAFSGPSRAERRADEIEAEHSDLFARAAMWRAVWSLDDDNWVDSAAWLIVAQRLLEREAA